MKSIQRKHLKKKQKKKNILNSKTTISKKQIAIKRILHFPRNEGNLKEKHFILSQIRLAKNIA